MNEEKLSFYNDEFEKKLEVENKSYSKIVLEDDFIFISSADLIYSDDKIVHDLIINKQFEIVYENTTTTTNYMYKRNKEYYCPGIIIIRNRNDFSFNDIIGFDLINLKFLSKDEVTERLDKYHEDNKESIIEIDGDILKLHDRTLEMEILKTNNHILKQIYDIYGYLRFDQVIVDNNETYIVMVNDKSFFGMVGMVPRSPRIVFRYNSDNTLTYIGYAHFTYMKVLKILKK